MIKTQAQKKAIKEFSKRWLDIVRSNQDSGSERKFYQKFWIELLADVFRVENAPHYIDFEFDVKLDKSTGFIDGYIDATKVLIEQKSINKNLRDGIRQSDGSILTPFQQAKRYSAELPYDKRPRWVVLSNFKSFLIFDMNKPQADPDEILLEELPKEFYRLNFLVNQKSENLKKEEELSFQAGEIVNELYEAFAKEYQDLKNPDSLHSLNELCVRMVFCLYAEDAGIFGKKNAFHDYLAAFSEPYQMRRALIDLFKMLDTSPEKRDPYEQGILNDFPYVNGGLFSNEDIEIPTFTPEIQKLILEKASDAFDWSNISPTIFGAVFESTLNPETRHSGGMHYTSIENIHKVIDPLFLDNLKEEFENIKTAKDSKNARTKKLLDFQEKLSTLTFFDPACGSGNFLTETYISLRKLENEVILERTGGQISLDTGDIIKVNINQFYGIEINDFAGTVAKTALWIAESQMLAQTQEIIHAHLDFLPLKSYTQITIGNALRLDWQEIVPKDKLNYIIGNPPFLGHSVQNKSQKLEIRDIFINENGKPYNLGGKIDYVAGWFFKASQIMQNTKIQTALVSTNSILQGEQVAGIWKPLFERFGVHFDFVYKTFKWNNEAKAKDQAAVHCVIVGFSNAENSKPKKIFEGEEFKIVSKISPYLVEGEVIFIESRLKPISEVPEMVYGSKPTDGGHFFLTPEEKAELLVKEPQAEKFVRKVLGAAEFLNNKERYVLWLDGANPAELRNCPEIMKRIKAVRDFRLNSPAPSTRLWAEKPTLFKQIAQPNSNYLLVPSVSSENRRYIPIGFLSKDTISTNANFIVPNATLYEFGVLTSNVHMAWMRAVAGRLESRYRYSNTLVYNNFPWVEISDSQKAKIEQTAQAILDARALYPESSLADLYHELTMPVELRKAHQQNDRAVMEAYGMRGVKSEAECVERLFEMYKDLVK